MKTVSLSGSSRENVGKKGAAELRKQERIPAVLYGGQQQVHFSISENEVAIFNKSYQEIEKVHQETLNFWNEVSRDGGKYLWFAFIPHILVKGEIDTTDFEVCTLK